MVKASAFVTIPTEGGDFPAVELQMLMTVFRSRYIFSVGVYDAIHDRNVSEEALKSPIADEDSKLFDINNIEEGVIFAVSKGYGIDWNWKAEENELWTGFQLLNPLRDLFISELRRTNPIEILVLGLAGPLAAAVVLSGGKIQIGSLLRVELPPIGKGIEELRRGLRPTVPQKIDDIRVRQKNTNKHK